MRYKGILKLRKPCKDNLQSLYFHHYDLVESEYFFVKNVNKKGRICSDTLSGNINAVLAAIPDNALMGWVFDHRKLLNGEITVHDTREEVIEKISFEAGRCVDFRLHYEPAPEGRPNVTVFLTINVQRMVLDGIEYVNS